MNINLYNNKGLTGLVNLGNSCYLNSIIQCLSNTIELTDYFMKDNHLSNLKDSDQSIIVKEYVKLLQGIWDENVIISPNSFYSSFRRYSYKYDLINFVDNRQNDAHEFLNLLIDIMHEGLSKEVNITISGNVINEIDSMALDAMKRWKDFFKSNYSKIIDIFYGQYISTIKSLDKQLVSKTYEPFPSIEIEIPELENVSIYDCFNHFISQEILDGENKYYWEDKNESLISTKNLRIWNCPKILIIVLKRFVNQNGKLLKNNKFINFPINNLNLVKYCDGYDKFNSIYNLYSICNHSGSKNFGHYYSYCKNNNGKWYEYNDNRVSEIQESKIITNNAYCLFYKKINE